MKHKAHTARRYDQLSHTVLNKEQAAEGAAVELLELSCL